MPGDRKYTGMMPVTIRFCYTAHIALPRWKRISNMLAPYFASGASSQSRLVAPFCMNSDGLFVLCLVSDKPSPADVYHRICTS